MTDKMAKNETDERRKTSIVERVAKRVSSDFSADSNQEETSPAHEKVDAMERPAAFVAAPVMSPATSVEEDLLDPQPADSPPVIVRQSELAPSTTSEQPGRSRPATKHHETEYHETAKVNGAPSIGAKFDIDLPRLSAAGYVTPNAVRNRKTEEYRLIKRALINRNKSGNNPRSNLILITSSLPDEGKTFTAINLAISMAAEENMSVLLIDADFNKRGAVRELGCPHKTGLIDVLENPNIDLADVMLKTNIPNFTFVPAGQPHKRSTELLASTRMARLAAEIGSRYRNRLIIFDCPPLLVTTEAAALTAHVGQVLFVIRAEETKENAVRHAIELIDEGPEVGLVLSRTHSRIGGSQLGGNYQSYSGYYGYDSK